VPGFFFRPSSYWICALDVDYYSSACDALYILGATSNYSLSACDTYVLGRYFAYAAEFQLQVTRPEPHVSFYFERNIVYWDNGSPLVGGCPSASPPCEINFKFDHNTYWNAAGKPPVFPGNLKLDQWREGAKTSTRLSPIRSLSMRRILTSA
jgi:hypothetical protein